MSRIGKKLISIPKGVNVTLQDGVFSAKGPKGQLAMPIHPNISMDIKDGEITFTRPNDLKENRAVHGLMRALAQNLITGVAEGYSKTLDIVGVGYRAEMKGANVLLSLGYSHTILFIPPEGIAITANTPTQLVVSGIDKQLVGQVAAKIRSFKKPEPYKGKGIKYSTETIRRKAGKTAGK